MKLFSRTFALVALIAAPAFPAHAFEGKVSLSMKSGREPEQRVDYAIKGGLVRMEMQAEESGQFAMILNGAKEEMTMLMPEQQMFMVMPLKARPSSGAAAKTQPEAKIEKTGRTETILGYLCEEYVTTEAGQTTEMWITDQLGNFMGLSAGANPLAGMMGGAPQQPSPSGDWEQALKGKTGFFPLRVVSRDSRGRETFRLETRQVEPGPLADSLFAPPAGWQKLDMPAMGAMPGFPG